ncbi:adenylate/guanylate cyclase domain-containing protein [Nocardiaceae bacterium YC2-7]|uniref:Adenylate/guanylate cyclase domain-containing protein n=1 Tax=Antrihabitans stalactiti TaxID=2584121 RepID=A0A848KN71_9NOCA|nr:adenylate/guanylate cyclase domain-containing protein [Antrihabitans stalactiti]
MTSNKSPDGALIYARPVADRPIGEREPHPVADAQGGSSAVKNAGRRGFAEWLEEANRRPTLIAAIRRFRSLLPGDPGFGDPLSTAGPGGASAVARAADRLVGDEGGVARELGLGALQVWQAGLERVGRGKGSREVTIVFTDLVGFSSWSLGAGDDATLELLRGVAKAIEPPIVERGGHVVKRMGDGLMAVFTSADRAVQAVVVAREHLEHVEVAGFKPQMRVGIHTGAPKEIGGDWLGVDVTIAARVMEAGGNGNTMISANTLQSLRPDTLEQLGFTIKPYRRSFFAAPLSGVPEDLRIFALKPL